jgi:hypothetical protein
VSNLENCPTLYTVMPLDLQFFLVWCDMIGKTQDPLHSCAYVGQKGIQPCSCRIALSSNTFSVMVHQLSCIFENCDRDRRWDE